MHVFQVVLYRIHACHITSSSACLCENTAIELFKIKLEKQFKIMKFIEHKAILKQF